MFVFYLLHQWIKYVSFCFTFSLVALEETGLEAKVGGC